MKIRTNVAPANREWARQKAAELASLTLDELRALGYEEADGYDKEDTIGIIIAVDAPWVDDDNYEDWDYTIEL